MYFNQVSLPFDSIIFHLAEFVPAFWAFRTTRTTSSLNRLLGFFDYIIATISWMSICLGPSLSYTAIILSDNEKTLIRRIFRFTSYDRPESSTSKTFSEYLRVYFCLLRSWFWLLQVQICVSSIACTSLLLSFYLTH